MIIEKDKIDCTDSIVVGINHTEQWRTRMAVKHPSDPRNARASACLKKLAGEVTLTDSEWTKLQKYYGWASEPWREAITKTARLAGFQFRVTNFHSFVEALLEVLSQPVEIA